jgi:hypothetical protein
MSNSSGLLGEALDATLQLEAERRDLSLAPDEAFGATGATSAFLTSQSGAEDVILSKTSSVDTPTQTGLAPGVSQDTDEARIAQAAREGPQPTGFERTVGVSREAFAAAQAIHADRSARAQRVDERRGADVTADVDKWARRPAELDFPGVDSLETIGPRF